MKKIKLKEIVLCIINIIIYYYISIFIHFEIGEPDPLLNCTLLNQTSTGFQIECIEGFDGGLQQDFIMEVYVNGTTRHPKIYKSK